MSCCNHQCNEGRTCPNRDLPDMSVDTPRLGRAVTCFAFVVFVFTFVAWLGLAAGYWGM